MTPIILKTEDGYWRSSMTVDDFLNRLKINLMKKYKLFYGEELDETENIFEKVEFRNTGPIKCSYKNINFRR